MLKLKQIIEEGGRLHHKFSEACFAGLVRAKHELSLPTRPVLDGTEDHRLRKIKLDLIAEIDAQYLCKPYVVGTSRENFRGTGLEYTGFRCGEFIAEFRKYHPV